VRYAIHPIAFVLINLGFIRADDGADRLVAARCEAYMQARCKVGRFSGTVLVARNGKPLFAKGFGMANRELDVPNSPVTKFRLASVSKQFTAVGIMILEHQGKLKLDEPISKYVSDVPEAWSKVTFHQLMSHTSGVPENLGVALFKGMWPQPVDPDHLLDLVKTKPLDFKPGDKWKYSNTGYELLGMAIEKISGMKYGDFLKMHIFEPLGMNDTGIDDRKLVLKNRASGYSLSRGQVVHATYIDLSQVFSAGSVFSTVLDLVKWDNALYTEQVLPKSALEKMWTVVKSDYGYGWMIAPWFGKKCVFHGGDLPGFHSLVSRFPDQKLFVAVLTNLESSPVARVARDLAAIAQGEPYDVPVAHLEAKIDPKILDKFVGEFEIDAKRKFKITNRDGQLYAQLSGQGRFPLVPESDTKFFARAEEATLTFSLNEKGDVTRFVFHKNGRDLVAKKVEPAREKPWWRRFGSRSD
jgi:CubicO group peptidase (beta-lactamase class C family)